MMTAVLAVKNILGAKHDLWQINTDHEYQEEDGGKGHKLSERLAITLNSTQPSIPERTRPSLAVPAVD